MKFTALLLILLLDLCTHTCSEQVYASLTVDPDRSQFFKYESLSLNCDQNRKTSGWTVKAKTVRGVSECGHDWGSLQSSSCIIHEAYQWNSGVYWCESTSGETSPAANITVTDHSVILESPVSPVMEGDSVTLRCTTQSNSSATRASIFMKSRSPVGAAITGYMTIPVVSKSSEGLYMCVVTDIGASAESWLTVRGYTQVSLSEGPHSVALPLLAVFRVILHVVVGTPYLASTILLGLIYRNKRKSQQIEETTNCAEVQIKEIM
ncbi:low affinity immunoglobulin gamma Fc region receptor II-like [Channa argus]|uniref:low affinity immunoglobulin gamma Fc region receptor II-like n=1 Tax=Channa argus TaxID=215402 RepID=UPI002946C020|nr:hypothetical protein Q8A73_012705 [Channa argus]